VKNPNVQRLHILKDRCSFEARARIPSPGIRKLHSIDCLGMHEVLFGSRWIWPRPVLMDHRIFWIMWLWKGVIEIFLRRPKM
jgi:hypothetical protein